MVNKWLMGILSLADLGDQSDHGLPFTVLGASL